MFLFCVLTGDTFAAFGVFASVCLTSVRIKTLIS